jgi:hypothetical protein
VSDDDGGVRCYDDRSIGAPLTAPISTLLLATAVIMAVFTMCAACVTFPPTIFARAAEGEEGEPEAANPKNLDSQPQSLKQPRI